MPHRSRSPYRLCSVRGGGKRRSGAGGGSRRQRTCACSSHCRRIAFLCLRRKRGWAIHALPARPPSRPIDDERPLLGHVRCRFSACPRVWQLSGVLLGLPVRLAGNVRPQVHERSAALPEGRTALHALRMQLQLAKGMELRSPVLSAAGRDDSPGRQCRRQGAWACMAGDRPRRPPPAR